MAKGSGGKGGSKGVGGAAGRAATGKRNLSDSHVLSTIKALQSSTGRVHLADLKSKLGLSLDHETFQNTMLRLQRDGKLSLLKNDNTAELRARDHAASIRIAGFPRHLVYLN